MRLVVVNRMAGVETKLIMAPPRDPETLQNLTKAHLQAAALYWNGGTRVSHFKATTPHGVVINGHTYPTKAIVALAHELAGLGTLTSEQLAGKAARRHLQALGFPLANANQLERLQRKHVESGAAAMREFMEHAIAQKHIAEKLHATEWRVGIDGLWYSPRALRLNAYAAAGLPISHDLSKSEYDRYRAHLTALGFPVERAHKPERARTTPRCANDLRRAASALIECVDDADPLQILLDGTCYPAGTLLGLMPGAALSDQDLAAISEAGAVLRTAPDPLDLELGALAARSDLSTEVRREVTARIGQGRFRAALMQLHGGCLVTGIATPEVLRAAHIHRWKDCAETPEARLDPENGLLLTANLDALFEVGLIAFGDDGEIVISPRLDADARAVLGIHGGMRLASTPSDAQRAYLAKHRDRIRAMHGDETA
ncbi:HNH endonuclease [Paraburkholderia pallida]|uniref:HNH endonuclease n=1 Tax=Paraburkholderia pallida TaxID=2547399 RepID=A0A4P7CMZ7_9BURK|nr:HNH endonuclease signature motif containing protein [Paraburkholderia pallida]QBQ95916.1 HNH endonuclease [Paraburkholderia pallida]